MKSVEYLLLFSKNIYHANFNFDENVVGSSFLKNVEKVLAPKKQQFTNKSVPVVFCCLTEQTDVEIILSNL